MDTQTTSPPESPATALADSSAVSTPLSKKAQKKAARAERFATFKLERRAREKETRKEKKAIRAAKRAAGELDEEEEGEKQKKKQKTKLSFNGRVVVDLGFDDKMSDKEVKSLCSQLAYTYSANRRAGFPFSLVFSSLNGKTLDKLTGVNDAAYKRWSHTRWQEKDYQTLWEPCPSAEAEPTLASTSSTSDKSSFVYLTADSEHELEELKPDVTYIIGGLCDHNRYKNICLGKAKEDGIRTARLPIGQYISLSTRKVLTVNQAFEILLHWVETRDWEKAFYAVIPKRKFQNGDGTGAAQEAAPTEEEVAEADGYTADASESNLTDLLQRADSKDSVTTVAND